MIKMLMAVFLGVVLAGVALIVLILVGIDALDPEPVPFEIRPGDRPTEQTE